MSAHQPMTHHPKNFELELARVSTQRLRPVSRAIEAQLPSDRSERLSLFPGWERLERAEMLNNIADRLEELGLAAHSLLAQRLMRLEQIATGDDARRRYLAAASVKGTTWPGEALIWSGDNDGGVVLATDPDATTLFMDCWGPDARVVCDDIFELIWKTVRKLR